MLSMVASGQMSSTWLSLHHTNMFIASQAWTILNTALLENNLTLKMPIFPWCTDTMELNSREELMVLKHDAGVQCVSLLRPDTDPCNPMLHWTLITDQVTTPVNKLVNIQHSGHMLTGHTNPLSSCTIYSQIHICTAQETRVKYQSVARTNPNITVLVIPTWTEHVGPLSLLFEVFEVTSLLGN